MGDGLRIREDALTIQEGDIKDTLETINTETTKISFALAFESILIVESLHFVGVKPYWFKATFATSVIVALSSAIISIFAKKLDSHTNVDELFEEKKQHDSWGEYLDNKHSRLNEIYAETQKLLCDKLFYTKLTFSSLTAAVVILIIGVFI